MSRKLAATLALAVCAAAAATAGVSLASADGRIGDDTVAMPREIVAAASAFCTYVEHASAVRGKLDLRRGRRRWPGKRARPTSPDSSRKA